LDRSSSSFFPFFFWYVPKKKPGQRERGQKPFAFFFICGALCRSNPPIGFWPRFLTPKNSPREPAAKLERGDRFQHLAKTRSAPRGKADGCSPT